MVSGGGGAIRIADRYFSFIPEYPNAVLISGGLSVGALSVENDGYHNTYDWTTLESSPQSYDILIRFMIPPDFDTMGSGVFIWNKVSDDSGNTAVRFVEMLDTDGNAVITASSIQNESWTETFFPISGGAEWDSGGLVQIRLRLYADTSDIAQVGEIKIPYTVVGSTAAIFCFVPEYDGFVIDPDGTNNTGTLDAGNDGTNNYFRWTTSEGSVQDNDIVIRFVIPGNLHEMGSALYLTSYVTDTLGNTAIRLVEFLDTAGNNVISAGSKKNASWHEDEFTITGGTWTPGGVATIRVRLFADAGDYAYLGRIRIPYTIW
jgi:hypothetical protein